MKPNEWLVRFNLSTEFADEYAQVWQVRCPQCGVPSGLCLSGTGVQQERPHSRRRTRARSTSASSSMRVEEPS